MENLRFKGLAVAIIHMNYWLKTKQEKKMVHPQDVFLNFLKTYSNKCDFFKNLGIGTHHLSSDNVHVSIDKGYVTNIIITNKGISNYYMNKIESIQEQIKLLDYSELKAKSSGINDSTVLHDIDSILEVKVDQKVLFEDTIDNIINEVISH